MELEETAADVPMTEEQGVIWQQIRKRHHKPDQRRKRIKQKRQKRKIKRDAIWESDYAPEWSDPTQGLAAPMRIIEVDR